MHKGLATLVALGLLLGGGAVLLVLGGAQSSAAAKPAGGLQLGLLDKQDASYVLLQLDPSKEAYGSFAISLPGTGLVWPKVPGDVTTSGATTHVAYDGDGYLDPSARLDTEFGVNFGLSGEARPVHVRVISSVDVGHHSGVLNVWVAGKHVTINATQAAPLPRPVADQYVAAVLAHDAGAIYDLADSDTHAAITREDFITEMNKGDQFAAITGASVSGDGAVTTTDAGISFATFPISLTTGGNTRTGSLTLVLDHGAWRVFTTS
jgi:hypothetical protein